jgi:Hypothetical protein (DUF2513)
MRRDMDLIRQLLLDNIESDDQYNGSGYGPVTSQELNQDQPPEVVLYHMKLLADAGLVDLVDWMADGTPLIRGVTWQGHEFLEVVRDPQIWERTKTSIPVWIGCCAVAGVAVPHATGLRLESPEKPQKRPFWIPCCTVAGVALQHATAVNPPTYSNRSADSARQTRSEPGCCTCGSVACNTPHWLAQVWLLIRDV